MIIVLRNLFLNLSELHLKIGQRFCIVSNIYIQGVIVPCGGFVKFFFGIIMKAKWLLYELKPHVKTQTMVDL